MPIKKLIFIVAMSFAILMTIALVRLSWDNLPPHHPSNLSSRAIFVETGAVPFRMYRTGHWLDCWMDAGKTGTYCRLTDDDGKTEYQGEFLPYRGSTVISEDELHFDSLRTGTVWTGSSEKHIHVPLIFLENGKIMLPKDAYEEAKKTADKVEAAEVRSQLRKSK